MKQAAIKTSSSASLAASITRSASKQTYYTIRWLVDRDRQEDAFQAYAYFRWVDDVLDGQGSPLYSVSSRNWQNSLAFAEREKSLIDSLLHCEVPDDLCDEERMLVGIVDHDSSKNSGLRIYLENMMEVMLFDAGRRNRQISQAELSVYSNRLAIAVTEALYYFIGCEETSQNHPARYMAVTAAHVIHMLRDTLEDVDNGYFNIPREYLNENGISARDVNSIGYRKWVCSRIKLAREYFRLGRECTLQIRNPRLKLAGILYSARFEWMLRTIEHDRYCLRYEYPERKSLQAALWMIVSSLAALFTGQSKTNHPQKLFFDWK